MDMPNYISNQLDKITAIKEKEMLRDVMEAVFLPMYDYVESEYERLKNRVKDQMPLAGSGFVIWSSLIGRKNAIGGCPYLFPMLEEDLELKNLELSDIYKRIRDGERVRLDTVFVQSDYLTCKGIEESSEIFDGTLKTEAGDIKIGVSLRLSKRYTQCIENLYRMFISNGIPWQTINAPYLYKMFDATIVRMEGDISKKSGLVTDYLVSYGMQPDLVKRDFVPVWNIEKLSIVCEDFPLAALDKINYEYRFDLNKVGAEHGYLADYGCSDISSARREADALVVTSPKQKGASWDMYKVMKRKEFVTEQLPFEVMGNERDGSFAARMVAHYGTVIKTTAELKRLIASHNLSQYVEFEGVSVASGESEGQTYDANGFIKDEIRDLAVSKSLVLSFRPVKQSSYILHDLMSFLVSQVQLIYPEFHCMGVFV